MATERQDDERKILEFVRSLSKYEQGKFNEMLDFLRENPSSTKLLAEARNRGLSEPSEILEFMKRKIGRRCIMNPSRRYNKDFCTRLQKMRQRAGYSTQAAFAKELGIPANNYASYETRTLLPHKLIPAACELLNCSPWMLLTGQPGQFSPPSDDPNLPLHSTPLIECGRGAEPC